MRYHIPLNPLGRELARLFPKRFSLTDGRVLRFAVRRREGYEIIEKPTETKILYKNRSELVMAVGELFLESTVRENVSSEKSMKFRAVMLDVSRGAVIRSEVLQERLALLALAGLTHFCLYTEDTFEFPGEALFGYGRGAYSQREIRSLVRFGKIFGLTLFPCIQTLGHMEQVLKYPSFHSLQDTEAVLDTRSPEVGNFLKRMIDAASSPYDTKLIHLGMDETRGLGRGHSYREGERLIPAERFAEHLAFVTGLCEKKGLEPMIWADMILGTGSPDRAMSDSEISALPRNLKVVYWDYDNEDPDFHLQKLRQLQKSGLEIIVAPGVWNWTRFFPAHHKALANIKAVLQAARSLGITSALNTQWGDDGHECFFDYSLPAQLVFLAECRGVKDAESFARNRLDAFSGLGAYDALVATAEVDTLDYAPKGRRPYNLGRCLFYDDPAQATFSNMPGLKDHSLTYALLADKLAKHAKKAGPYAAHLRLARDFCFTLEKKAGLRKMISTAYENADRAGLKEGLQRIVETKKSLRSFSNSYRRLWLSERKAYGLEVVQQRLGALLLRLDHLHALVSELLSGKRKRIEELELSGLPWFAPRSGGKNSVMWKNFHQYHSSLASRSTAGRW